MENKKKVKVKSFIRKGRVVKSYSREQENDKGKLIASGLGGLLLGGGLVGAGILIGKSKKGNVIKQVIQNNDVSTKKAVEEAINKIPKPKSVNTDEIVKNVISRIPTSKPVDTDGIVKDIISKIDNNRSNLDDKNKVEILSKVEEVLKQHRDGVDNIISNISKKTSDTDELVKQILNKPSYDPKDIIDLIDAKIKKNNSDIINKPISLGDDVIDKPVVTYNGNQSKIELLIKLAKDKKNVKITPELQQKELGKRQKIKSIFDNNLDENQLDDVVDNINEQQKILLETMSTSKDKLNRKEMRVLERLSDRNTFLIDAAKQSKENKTIATSQDNIISKILNLMGVEDGNVKKETNLISKGDNAFLKKSGITSDIEDILEKGDYDEIPDEVFNKIKKNYERPKDALDYETDEQYLARWKFGIEHILRAKGKLKYKNIVVDERMRDLLNDDFKYNGSISNFNNMLNSKCFFLGDNSINFASSTNKEKPSIRKGMGTGAKIGGALGAASGLATAGVVGLHRPSRVGLKRALGKAGFKSKNRVPLYLGGVALGSTISGAAQGAVLGGGVNAIRKNDYNKRNK